MDNNEIRVSILFHYYRAMYNNNSYGIMKENQNLKDIPKNIINANISYLMGKNLLNGKKTYCSNNILFHPTDITSNGMDIVEQIINESLDKIDNKYSNEIKSTPSNDRANVFYKKCIEIMPICNTMLDVSKAILVSL